MTLFGVALRFVSTALSAAGHSLETWRPILKEPNVLLWIVLAVLFAGCSTAKPVEHRLFDLHLQQDVDISAAVDRLRQSRVVLVGEHHTTASHHQAQLLVIRKLHEAGVKLAIGLEMFRSDSQTELDRWVNGELPTEEFEGIYYDNWNYDWSMYRPIFEYAKQQRIPMVGLNVPRDITRQVARQGFQSLSEDQKEKLLAKLKKERTVGLSIQRYKGLGEMNPDQLWTTTMNPDNRILLRVTIENAREADKIFDVLMGDEVLPRKKFIQTYAKNVKNLDT